MIRFFNNLEIGSGIGEHLKYEQLSKKEAELFAMDSRSNVLKQLKKEHPNVKTILEIVKKIKQK